jgi:putative tryptophan/tyrosine transport system substrate-binding protein
VPTIGFLGAGTSSVWSQWTAAFVRRLRELGWVEGRNVTIEYRSAEGRAERYGEIATEFARLKVDVIVTVGSAVPATMQVTTTIPIVFAIAVDPLGGGVVASPAKPGGNVTGFSIQAIELPGKRIELLRAVVPHLHRLAVIANVGYPVAVYEAAEVQAAAHKLGIEIEMLEIRRAEDIAPAFEKLKSGKDSSGASGWRHAGRVDIRASSGQFINQALRSH